MSPEKYIAQAVALRVMSAIERSDHLFCPELPQMDVRWFLKMLGDTKPNQHISLALVGYGLSDADLKARIDNLRPEIDHTSTDLHVAAEWRNSPEAHPCIIALAVGRHPGVSTLAHFPRGSAQDLARTLLRWARESDLGVTPTQRGLLDALRKESKLAPLISLDAISRFLSAWKKKQKENELDAPRQALPMLGLLPDDNLLAADQSVGDRLHKNSQLIQEIKGMAPSRLDSIRRNVQRTEDPALRDELCSILGHIEMLRQRNAASYNNLKYEDAKRLIELSRWTAKGEHDIPAQKTLGHTEISRDAGSALIDGNKENLQNIYTSVKTALDHADDHNSETAKGSYEYGDKQCDFELSVDTGFLTWVQNYCNADNWGGYYETENAPFEEILNNYQKHNCVEFQPNEHKIHHDEDSYNLRSFLEPMQKALREKDITNEDFCGLWDQIVATRSTILDSLGILVAHPMLAIAAQYELRKTINKFIATWEQFYRKLADYYLEMHNIDSSWTRALFDAVASLDVVQIKTQVDSDQYGWKAVLLPTHPLHLWRYERMVSLSEGLNFENEDREAVLNELKKPEHFLGVIHLTSFPEGRGGSRPLPVARDYNGLAVFENFQNAYSGLDDLETLPRCIRQFALIYPNHVQPLRIALINPPSASHLLVKILKSLQENRNSKTNLFVDVYATPNHKARLRDARRFSTTDRDQIEEYIRSNRLNLRVHDEILPIKDRLRKFSEERKPVHIIAVFDEATTDMRQVPQGKNLLPMSPFAMRRNIEFLGIKKRIELQTSADETVFRAFYDMIGKLKDVEKGHTPQASADAEQIRKLIDDVLKARSAFWFFFADRALPSPGGIKSSCIFKRHGRHRQSVCYDASYERLALSFREPLDNFNLRFPVEQLKLLLRECVNLVGDGLIDLLQTNGQPNVERIRGLFGALIAARDYRKRHPGALLVSIDSEIVRLWLRLAKDGERCDLLGLRADGDDLIVETIEVKTTKTSGTSLTQANIEKARSQIESTLGAVRSGLGEDKDMEDSSPLSAPRQEMLKEVFVAGCHSQTKPDDRQRWATWLQLLFGQIPRTGKVRSGGIIYSVELSNNSKSAESTLARDPCTIIIRHVREARIHELIFSGENGERVSNANRQSPVSNSTHMPMPAIPISTIPKVPSDKTEAQDDASVDIAPPLSTTIQPAVASQQGVYFRVGKQCTSDAERDYYLHPSNTKLNQLNIGIVGDLGTGKTQLTQSLIYNFVHSESQNRGHRPKFLIFDYKQDYTKPEFVKSIDARVIKPHNIPLNIFELDQNIDDTQSARLGRVKFLNDTLHKIYGGIGHKQRNQIKTAVMQSYDKTADRPPTLSDVLCEYKSIVGEKIDAPYSILSDLVDFNIFVSDAKDAMPFQEFFDGTLVIDLASLTVGEKERNALLVLFMNFFHEYMHSLEKKPYIGESPKLRFIDSMILVDEADNVMKYNFDVLRSTLLRGREFGVGVLLASQYLSHFKTRQTDYTEPLLTWFIHKVPNITPRDLDAIGLNNAGLSVVEKIKSQDVHECLYKTLDVPGRFMRGVPFYEIEK